MDNLRETAIDVEEEDFNIYGESVALEAVGWDDPAEDLDTRRNGLRCATGTQSPVKGV